MSLLVIYADHSVGIHQKRPHIKKKKNMSRLQPIDPSTATGKAKEVARRSEGQAGYRTEHDQGDGFVACGSGILSRI